MQTVIFLQKACVHASSVNNLGIVNLREMETLANTAVHSNEALN